MNDRHDCGSTTARQKWITAITHFLCLCIIFILPEVMMSRSIPGGGESWRMYIKSLIFVAAFYINYYILIDRCIGKRHWVISLIAWNIVVIAVSMTIVYFTVFPGVSAHNRPIRPGEPENAEFIRRVTFMLRDIVMVALTVALSVAMKLSDYWSKLRSQQQEMQSAQQKEELQSLKNQLNPHFLFNTLNSIYALIAINQGKAQKAVHELSRLLRYVLYKDTPTVALSEELAFIDSYVKLMKLRMSDANPVNVTLDAGDYGDYPIAPLLFISPVENAFKHGNTGHAGDSIDISIIAREGRVSCVVSNHFITCDRPQDSGIGNTNLKRRLELIYGDRAEITTETTGDIHTLRLTIKI